jgi:hypothetical protein
MSLGSNVKAPELPRGRKAVGQAVHLLEDPVRVVHLLLHDLVEPMLQIFFTNNLQSQRNVIWTAEFPGMGCTKANGREPKTGLGRVFNFKLGCFDDVRVFIYADADPHR